jgi:hypothetical protein
LLCKASFVVDKTDFQSVTFKNAGNPGNKSIMHCSFKLLMQVKTD